MNECLAKGKVLGGRRFRGRPIGGQGPVRDRVLRLRLKGLMDNGTCLEANGPNMFEASTGP